MGVAQPWPAPFPVLSWKASPTSMQSSAFTRIPLVPPTFSKVSWNHELSPSVVKPSCYFQSPASSVFFSASLIFLSAEQGSIFNVQSESFSCLNSQPHLRHNAERKTTRSWFSPASGEMQRWEWDENALLWISLNPFIQIIFPVSLPLCTLALGRRSDIDQKAWHRWMRACLQTVGLFPKVLRTQKKRFPISLTLCILSTWQVFRDRLKGMASLEACLQTVRLLFPSYWKHWNHLKKMMNKFLDLIFQMPRLSSFGRWWLPLQRVPKAWLYKQQWYSQWRRWSYQCTPESFLTLLYLTNPSRNQ